ncbi:M3 family oligoendopeptidase [Paenibacillus mucilaginosus]|uniref:Oligoendopeptidase n=2 Tax=Paenibacillus mucilaginosus TaxID=61624 RepID=I0BCN8_9BACL|nr:M3 family oligoendopeptidase [Paenibacillus mucilaginosus]AEI42178.1 oligoendopeptidase F [Paenibacillus mucilaginosus KNP414]AFH60135.1 oligoendopeptidase [Paenibacillus mucilaginosus K02]MCG7214149.1 M3 family oligoendopeptidase [Paenibacillus mucilaginosus]WDM28668.1 M3 family oligoendopeptidase [Paenibacillus mucilaginosus]
MKTPLPQTWNLERFFPGGSASAEFGVFLDGLRQHIAEAEELLRSTPMPASPNDVSALLPLIALLQKAALQIREADSFTGCLAAENQNDKRAVILGGQVRTLGAAYASALTRFDDLLTRIPEEAWEALLALPELQEIRYPLAERRELAAEKLPPEQEALVNELAVDGYHGWGELYNTTVSKFRVPYEENGVVTELSAGQAANKMDSPQREIREKVFRRWEEQWGRHADYCADALNHLGGFRLKLYERRGWEGILKEPLSINRMSQETLDTMWKVIEDSKDVFVRYLERKAKLLGLSRLSWFDVDAPVGSGAGTISYDAGAELIVGQFRRFSPKMADFAVKAFENAWIEAEDRPGKRPGGFCTSFPVAEETRIFMTYAGSASNVSTLAHELGHAYHQHVMNDLPAFAQEYAMNVAETASTFAEMVVSDAAVKGAATEAERLALIEDKIQRSVAFYMNIHARFLFETRFYEERSRGLVSVDRLNELMTEAQREAYRGALEEYHPHFWASKLHFYITEVPFYNFPYTFGYMFSAGLYAEALKRGEAFEDQYVALLRDTGRMTVEELAQKHLGVDLRRPDFWQGAMSMSVGDVEEFLRLTE